MQKIHRRATAVCLLILSVVTFCHAEDEVRKAIDKGLLVGVWMPIGVPTPDGVPKPRIEYKKDGSFRMQSQFGEEKTGTWKWTGDDAVELTYPAVDRVIQVKVLALSKEKMTTHVRRDTTHVRIASWTAKVPEDADPEDKDGKK